MPRLHAACLAKGVGDEPWRLQGAAVLGLARPFAEAMHGPRVAAQRPAVACRQLPRLAARAIGAAEIFAQKGLAT
jgi:hypothetical protein